MTRTLNGLNSMRRTVEYAFRAALDDEYTLLKREGISVEAEELLIIRPRAGMRRLMNA